MKEENCTCTDECLGYLTKTCKGIETLEEAAERLTHTDMLSWENTLSKASFMRGAKWQQERSYSEKDMKDAYCNGTLGLKQFKSFNESFYIWFEQFKKK